MRRTDTRRTDTRRTGMRGIGRLRSRTRLPRAAHDPSASLEGRGNLAGRASFRRRDARRLVDRVRQRHARPSRAFDRQQSRSRRLRRALRAGARPRRRGRLRPLPAGRQHVQPVRQPPIRAVAVPLPHQQRTLAGEQRRARRHRELGNRSLGPHPQHGARAQARGAGRRGARGRRAPQPAGRARRQLRHAPRPRRRTRPLPPDDRLLSVGRRHHDAAADPPDRLAARRRARAERIERCRGADHRHAGAARTR